MWATQALAAFQDPQTVVKSGTNQVLQILKQYPQDSQARREKIRAVVDKYFDFEDISRRTSGLKWQGLSPQDRPEFTLIQ